MPENTAADRDQLERLTAEVHRVVLGLQKLEDITTEAVGRGSDQSQTCSSKSTGGCCIQSYGSLQSPRGGG